LSPKRKVETDAAEHKTTETAKTTATLRTNALSGLSGLKDKVNAKVNDLQRREVRTLSKNDLALGIVDASEINTQTLHNT